MSRASGRRLRTIGLALVAVLCATVLSSTTVLSATSPAADVASIASAQAVDGWVYADQSSEVFGFSGPIYRFAVRVEEGLAVDPEDVVLDVMGALNDHRSWIGIRSVRFQLTTETDVDFTVSVASPATVDRMCLPLRTVGRLSCGRGRQLAANVDRWMRGPNVYHDGYAHDLDTYRTYLINHEVGHLIGEQHVVPQYCSPSRRAPVMMQQTFGLRGCATNGWPAHDLDPAGRLAEVSASIGGGLRRKACAEPGAVTHPIWTLRRSCP